jgi:hypothetical protein
VLRPGGLIALTTNLQGHMREFYAEFRATLDGLGMRNALGALERHVRHRATPKSLRGQLAGAGLEVTEVATGEFRMRFADGSALLRHVLVRFGFLPAWKAIVPAGELARVFVELERRLNAVAARRGELALTVPMACVTARKPRGG